MKKALSMDDFIQNYRVLLTEEQENDLFKLWWDTKDDNVLLEIVKAYSPIIQRCVRELAGYKANPEDLRSEGVIALLAAAKNFQPDVGRFATYAKQCIKGIMLGFITKNYFPVNVCTSHGKKKLFFSIRKLVAVTLVQEGKFEMTRDIALDLAASHEVEESVVYSMYDMIRKPHISLSEKIPRYGLESDHTIEEHLLLDDDAEDVSADLTDLKFHRRIIDTAMDEVLDNRERRIFESQMLVNREDRIILEDLGAEFDISKERVRQLRNGAYAKVKRAIIRSIGSDPNMF